MSEIANYEMPDIAEFELADWRRRVGELYAAVRADDDPERAHRLWRTERDRLFRSHPQSPLPADDPMRSSGVPYWPYDAAFRFELTMQPIADGAELALPTDGNHTTTLRLIGGVDLPSPLDAPVDVWWLEQYGGGIFIPFRDGTAGKGSYGGGRYLLDTAKGADLGLASGKLVVDLNFLYHPSCRYNYEWQCPLAPRGNTIAAPVEAGERL